ncbi:MAG: TniQ family protein, partial [Oscillospiraceae bacterium]
LHEHTLFSYYARFWSADRKRSVEAALFSDEDTAVFKVGMYQASMQRPLFFRYCPQCYQEDIARYGEPYWHRQHQLADLDVCVKHRCYLQETNISLRNSKSILCPAADIEQFCTNPSNNPLKLEIKFAEVVTESLTQPLLFDDGMQYKKVYDKNLKERRWRSPTGKRTNTAEILASMQNFYKESIFYQEIETERLNALFCATKSVALRMVLLAAVFFDLSLESLFDTIMSDDVVSKMKELASQGVSQREIARRFSIDAATVRRWINPPYKNNAVRTKKVRKAYPKTDWNKLDEQWLPLVVNILNQLEQGKPQQVTFPLVARLLSGVSPAQLHRMEQCASRIKTKIEPIQTVWEHRLQWAEQELIRQEKAITETAIFKMAGINKKRYYKKKYARSSK